MDETITTLCERLRVLLEKNPASSHRRILVAFAGTPGSGKTTISAALTKIWNAKCTPNSSITVLPMVRPTLLIYFPSQVIYRTVSFLQSRHPLTMYKTHRMGSITPSPPLERFKTLSARSDGEEPPSHLMAKPLWS